MTMFGAFRGKLFSAGYWCNVAASWSSYLIQLNKDDTPKFEVDADGNVECAGDVTANGVLLGAGGAGTPGGDNTEIQFNDSSAFAGDSALTWNKTTQTLAAPILDLGATSTITDVTNSGVLGGIDNQLINADGCVVSGDKNTIEWAEYSAIIGGIESVIGQGADASEKSSQCFVAGGEAASGIGHSSRNCSVTGGYTTTIGNGCAYDFIGGGLNNAIADGVVSSVIGGGQGNAISGAGGAVIPGGFNNTVSGTYGIASGIGATSAHDGSVVWCDSTGATTPLASSAANEWTARATGGFRLYNAPDGSKYATLAAGELTVSDKVITPALKVTGGTPGAGKVLTSDDDGDATWAAAASPGGNDGQIQYNNSGAFGGTTGLTWNSTTGTLGVGVSATGGVVNIASDATQTPITITKAHDADNTVATAVLVKQNIGAAGGAATGFGSQIAWKLDTTTTDNQDAAYMSASWYDGAHATRRGQLTFGVTSYAGTQTGLRIIADNGTPNIVGGYSGNSVTGGNIGSVICGGGGYQGWQNNTIGGSFSVIIGGYYNSTGTNKLNTILGGYGNSIGGNAYDCTTLGDGNSIGNASWCIRLLGDGNRAAGSIGLCYAFGRTNHLAHNGAIMLSDGSTTGYFYSHAANSLAVRATGGIRLATAYAAKTCTAATDDYITCTSHGWADGDTVQFRSENTIPGGITIGNVYYIINSEEHKFKISLTRGGGAVDITSTGVGTITVYRTIAATIDTTGVFQPGGGYKSVDGTAGMSDSRSWTDADANDHAVTIKNGLITAWTVTPPA